MGDPYERPNAMVSTSRSRVKRRLAQYDQDVMKKAKRSRLESLGWRVGSAAEFLELSSGDIALVETKLALSGALRARREARKLTQQQLAQLLKSSQSRVAKMEAGDSSVSVDLLLKGLFALGANAGEVGRTLQSAA
jgi:ribosome-binding protein aMBF1 (putative translation factor)